MNRSYIAVDIETTGLSPEDDKIIEIGAVKYVDGKIVDIYSSFVNPERALPSRIVSLTGITDDMLTDAKGIEEVMPEFLDFVDSELILGHNINFDFSFLKTAAHRLGHVFEKKGIDTLKMARILHPELPSKSLDSMCNAYGITRENKHRAYDDAKAAAELYENITKRFEGTEYKVHADTLNYQPKKQAPMTVKQKKYLLDLIEYHKIDIEIHLNELTKSTASKLIDKIILEHGMLFCR